MRALLAIITFLSFITCYSQVNPNYHKVKGYTRKDGTYVKPHHRTNRNNTNRDNYSTKPNINPWTGKKGYITPDNNRTYYNSSISVYRKPTNYPRTLPKTSETKKTISTYYPTKGNSRTRMIAKLRDNPSSLGNVIIRIPKGAKVHVIKKEDDYWKIRYGSWTGYLNEIYLISYNVQNRNSSTKNSSKQKPISTYYPTEGNSKTRMVAKLRNKASSIGNVIIRIPKGAKVQVLNKEYDYWKVRYGSLTGYLNEIYLASYIFHEKNTFSKSLSKEKKVSTYYQTKGNSKTRMIAKLRNKPSPLGNVIIRIPKGAKVNVLKKEDDYRKVRYGNLTGYLNEIYLE